MARRDNTTPSTGSSNSPSHGRPSYGALPSTSRRDDALPPPKGPSSTPRALAPDLLRGFLMLAMALDHTALALNTWEHGTGRVTEMDGVVVTRWNRPAAFVVRTLTHLCAPGFTFLLGIGVVYLGRSRSRLGWGPGRLLRYFAVRAGVLTLVNVVLGVLVSGGEVWFMNFVLFALAVDYFLAGVLWVVLDGTEPWLARVLSKRWKDDEDQDVEEPLLRPIDEAEPVVSARATSLSWHMHNGLLLVLGLVTIWWNIWLSPTGGHCHLDSDSSSSSSPSLSPSAVPGPEITTPAMSSNPLLGIWFWIVQTPRVVSVFPPLAWLSFAVLGLLYARVHLARPWSPRTLLLAHVLAALTFFLVFVLTRVLRFGNLSEDCLHTPQHALHPDRNPYLVSVQAFLYIVKYPPDVAFWSFTLSGTFFLLALFAGLPARVASRLTMLLDFGRAALFFYVAHLVVVFVVGGLVVKWFGHDVGIPSANDPEQTRGVDSLWGYLLVWACCMLGMWPVVRWYGRFKATKPADSIWRFF